MGHESQIKLWSPNLTTFCFIGFGTDRLRRREAMKTADTENPIHGATWPRHRAHGVVGQNLPGMWNWISRFTAVSGKLQYVLLRRITSERRVIQPELSGLCKSADTSAQVLFCLLARSQRT